MNFRQQFILGFIIVQALVIFTIVFLNLSAVKNNSYKLISDQVDSSTLLLSEVLKTPLLMSDLATLDDALKSFVSVKHVVTASVYDAKGNKIATANNIDPEYLDLLQRHFKTLNNSELYAPNWKKSIELDKKYLLPVVYQLDVNGVSLGSLRYVYDATEIELNIYENEQLTYLLAFVSIIMGLITAIVLGDRLTGALHRLIRSANKIAKGKTVKLENHNWAFEEIAELSQAMDSMQQQIKLRNDSLIEAERLATKASKAKSEFLAVMSHEIRTPLNGMLGSLGLVEPQHLSDENKQYFKTVLSSSEMLLSIINDILDYSKIEAGKLTIASDDVDITQVLKDTKAIYAGIAQDKNVAFEINCDKLEHKYFLGDEVRIKQIVNNIVSNALKFTDKGSVKVNVTNNDDLVVFEIEDTGIGIDSDKCKNLFQDFSQVHKGASRNYGGTGLGLAISMRLAKLMRGTIKVESELGEGSTFRVELNLKQTEKTTVIEHDKAAKKLTDIAIDSLENIKVLLVEDNKVNQMIAMKFLEKAKCKVLLAENGKEALEQLEKQAVDVILMDCQMPVMDGYEASRRIKEIGLVTPIIALTANAQDSDRKLCIASGMDGFLSKPFKADELYQTIASFVATH